MNQIAKLWLVEFQIVVHPTISIRWLRFEMIDYFETRCKIPGEYVNRLHAVIA
jgi:hypothetical protein